MKTLFLLSISLALGVLGLTTVRAQFPDFPAADLELGAPDFTTGGTGASSPFGMGAPTCVAIDPVSQKVFVVALGQRRILRFASAASLTNGANAEAVLGQINFSGISSGLSQTKFGTNLTCCHLDKQGRLWVADRGNNRILMFHGAATLSNGAPADLVIGQVDFVTGTSGTTGNKLSNPFDVFVDANDNLWVADGSNNRVLKYPNASTLSNGAAATVALGQPDLTTVTSGTSDVKFNFPSGLTVDASGTLWVADNDNDRVIRFDNAATLASGAAASAVLGQTDFVSATSGLSASKFDSPTSVALDKSENLYVLDGSNQRILFFRDPKAKINGAPADGVIGQTDFISEATAVSARQFDTNPGNGIDFDSSGALWTPDQNNNRVLRFSPDKTKPILRVTTRVPATVSGAILALKGKATDANGIEEVRFRTGNGTFAKAKGTTAWSAKARLRPGRNKIEIKAIDTVGNESAVKRLRVTRG